MEKRRFEGRVAVVTGGAHGIGRAIAGAFAAEGAAVHIIDTTPGDWFVGDISDPRALERFAAQVVEESGRVDFLINNAPPPMLGIVGLMFPKGSVSCWRICRYFCFLSG